MKPYISEANDESLLRARCPVPALLLGHITPAPFGAFSLDFLPVCPQLSLAEGRVAFRNRFGSGALCFQFILDAFDKTNLEVAPEEKKHIQFGVLAST